MTFPLDYIISGGQTGADLGGLRGAQAFGIRTGGWMPLGWITENGPKPEYERLFGMKEHPVADYPPRTRANIDESHGTLIISQNWDSRGTVQTVNLCQHLSRPSFRVTVHSSSQLYFEPRQDPADCAGWIFKFGIRVLNIAGNRESKARGITDWSYEYTRLVIAALHQHAVQPINVVSGGDYARPRSDVIPEPHIVNDRSMHLPVWPSFPSGQHPRTEPSVRH